MTRFPSLFKSMKTKLRDRRLKKDEKGVAMIEFAVAMPVLTVLLLGCIDLAVYLTAHQRIARSAYTMSNLMTQMDQGLTEAQVSDMMLALDQVSKPFDVSDSGVATITAIVGQDAGGGVLTKSVAWQRCYGANESGSKYGSSGTNVPDGDIPANTIMSDSQILLVTEVEYTYEPILGFLPLDGQIEYEAFFRPRRGTIENIIADGSAVNGC